MTDYERERNKKEFVENEGKMRDALIGFIFAVVALVIILIFFRSQIWPLIVDIAVLIGLAVDILTLAEKGKEWRQ